MMGHAAAYGPRRHSDSELQPQFRGDALLTPGAIRRPHVRNKSLEVGGNPRPTARPRLCPPHEAIQVPMPPDERGRTHERQQLPPGDKRDRRTSTTLVALSARFGRTLRSM
jgi:hypothetical protein